MIIGLDPGFAHFGYCLADNWLDVIDMGTIRTKKCDDYSNAEDIFSRCQDIGAYLAHTVSLLGGDVYAVCVEGMSYPRNASSAVKLGAAHGVVAQLTNEWCPERIVVLSPQAIRKTITGKKKGYTEEEVHKRLRFDDRVDDWAEKARKWELPHALDARAAMVAAQLLGRLDY